MMGVVHGRIDITQAPPIKGGLQMSGQPLDRPAPGRPKAAPVMIEGYRRN